MKSNEFKTMLQDYADYATSYAKYKCYEKMPYSMWADIKHDFVGKNITLDFDTKNGEVILSTNDGKHMTFFEKDGGFGSYLYDEFSWRLNLDDYAGYYTEYREDGTVMSYKPERNRTVASVSSGGGTYAKATASTTTDEFSKLKNDVDKLKNDKKKDEENTMKGFNFDFGPCTNDNVKMSMYGLAVQNNAGVWVSYNAKSGELIDVDILNFDGRKFMFKMPVAIKDIKVGDIVVHNRIPMFVIGIDNGIVAVDPRAGEEKKIIPTTNMFGFNFVTKVVSMFNAVGQAPTPDAPFGNMLPFMLMSEDNKDIDPMMLMFMMNQNGGAGTGFDMSNPMMWYFLMGKDGKTNSDMLPFMMMMMGMNQQTQAQATAHTCNCGGHQE